jgi:hypothetical protein
MVVYFIPRLFMSIQQEATGLRIRGWMLTGRRSFVHHAVIRNTNSFHDFFQVCWISNRLGVQLEKHVKSSCGWEKVTNAALRYVRAGHPSRHVTRKRTG